MAGSTRAPADSHDEAYKLGLAGKPLPSRLLRLGETDDSILDSWREGKSDRPEDQPDSSEEQEEQESEDQPVAPKAKGPRTVGLGPNAPRPSPQSSRSKGRARRTGRPTLADPTGGRLPIGFDGDGLAGAFFGAILYALIISVADYGTAGPLYWFKAKFLNQPAPPKT